MKNDKPELIDEAEARSRGRFRGLKAKAIRDIKAFQKTFLEKHVFFLPEQVEEIAELIEQMEQAVLKIADEVNDARECEPLAPNIQNDVEEALKVFPYDPCDAGMLGFLAWEVMRQCNINARQVAAVLHSKCRGISEHEILGMAWRNQLLQTLCAENQ